MRQIGAIQHQDHAERFSDYLLASGVPNMVEEGSSGWAVWVEDDDHLDRARTELRDFEINPEDPKYSSATKTAEKVRVEEEKKQHRLRKRFIDVRTRWGAPAQYARPVTIALVAICIVVGLATRFGSQADRAKELLLFTPVKFVSEDQVDVPKDGLIGIKRGEVWRLITPIFFHFDIFHLLFNMLWLTSLGSLIETRRGSIFLLILVLVSGIVSNFAEYLWQPNIAFFGGMSGVVYALFGYAWIKSKYQPHLQIHVGQETVWIMLAWLVLCMTGIVGAIANAAHVMGLVSGVTIAYAPVLRRRLLKL